ncbi:MAG: glycosyltransferase [Acholeplasmatales bacterium]|nr:glycosyltransferase [Acholeplasmatales bacterium]
MKNVLVLLATYNGEKYLRCQIDSILNQKDVNVSILASDDLSKDSTPEILEEYKNKYSNFNYYINKMNKNFTYNFIDLIFAANKIMGEFDFYAFSDQDDFWEEDKLINAIKHLETDKPKLYMSNLKIVNEDLEFDGKYMEDDSIDKCNKGNFIFENICTGCTAVYNNAFQKRILEYYPREIKYHDYWVFLLAAYTAEYYYDDNSYIKYRQHNSQQVGENHGKSFSAFYKKWKESESHQARLCEEVLNGYKQYISHEDYIALNLMANYKKKFKYKWKLMWSKKYRRRNHNLFKRIKLLFNKY